MADRLEAGLRQFAEGPMDVVLLDLMLPDTQGLDGYQRLHLQQPHTPIVVLSGLDDKAFAVQAVAAGGGGRC